MALAFALLVGALVVFALELFPIDFVAFAILALILLLGPMLGVAPEEAISGFSNPATITVLAMFILSAGIHRTGLINLLLRRAIAFAGNNEQRQLITIMLVAGSISGFINDTATVAILLPLVVTMAREHRTAPAKLLIPLSYMAQLGGVITLIGTSSNILASSLMEREGYGAFGMFAFSKIGLLILATGSLYLLVIGRRLLPQRQGAQEVAERYEVRDYLTEVLVLEDSPLLGKTLIQSRLSEQFDVTVLDILRHGERLGFLVGDRIIEPGDILLVRASTEQLLKIKEAQGLAIEAELRLGDGALKPSEMGLMEVIIGPNSELLGGTLESTNFRNRYQATVIAIEKRGQLIRERLGKVRLRLGTSLLVQGERSALEQLKREPGLIVTEERPLQALRTEKIPVALAIVAGVIVTAALGLAPILVTAIVGCVLMVLTGCLTVNELHEAIRWDVILLLAGVIPLGLTLERTGGAQLLADLAARSAVYVPPVGVLGIFYAMTMVLTELISNNASVVVMVPVGVITAQALGLDPRAFILAVMFAASTSFSTPVGYQTNMMVYGPGGYRFSDYLKVGGPLNLLLAVATPIYIYLLWGL